MDRDPYEVVGVQREASKEEITAAYRRRARELHPDRNPNDPRATEKLTELNQAYAVLSDDEKRLLYDSRSASPFQGAPFPGVPHGYEDLFKDFATTFRTGFRTDFRARTGRPPAEPAKGKDVEIEVHLTLTEAVMGTDRQIRERTGPPETCSSCRGSRTERGGVRMPCQACAGTGRNMFPSGGVCPSCAGRGDIPHRPCRACSGMGTARSVREITLKIPCGISEGQKLRLAGQGEVGSAGIPGDMYVTVKVAEDPKFSRRGNNIHTSVRVPFHDAVLGNAVRVRGIDGIQHEVRIPGSVRPGETVLVVEGAGVPSMRGKRGDMTVLIHVDMPEPKTAREAFLLRELALDIAGIEDDDLSMTGR